MHILDKGYKHKDRDFKNLSAKVGAPRYCSPTQSYEARANYEYICTNCGTKYLRIKSKYKYHEMWQMRWKIKVK